MAGPSRTISTSAFTCIICCEEGEFFCVGSCDHPICFICSVRIRVLCEVKDCPICRGELTEVYFLRQPQHYQAIDHRRFIWNDPVGKKFGYKFENEEALDAFYGAQSHVCPVCEDEPEFNTFRQLKDHVSRKHELFYCDLCLEHLKLFSWEKKLYTRKELGSHKRVGDANDKSHKGHPLCQFCDRRYLDNDLLYRHLRTDHYFCHLCDADGHNKFYDDYPHLREHFKADHFLCEEGRCKDEQFTGVFRTELDLKGHKSSVHGRDMQRSQLKQERVLNDPLLIRYEQYVPPASAGRGGNTGRRGAYNGRDSGEFASPGGGRGNSFRGSGRGRVGQKEEDPDLQAAMEASLRDGRRANFPEFNAQQTEFPSLDGRQNESAAVGISRRPQWGHRNTRLRSGELDEGEFPSLRDKPNRSEPQENRQRINPNSASLNNGGSFRNAQPPVQQQPNNNSGPYRRQAGNRDFVMIDNDDYPSLSGGVVAPAAPVPRQRVVERPTPKAVVVTDHFNPPFFNQKENPAGTGLTTAQPKGTETVAPSKSKGSSNVNWKELLKAGEISQPFTPSWGLGPKPPTTLSHAASVLSTSKSNRNNVDFPSLQSAGNSKKIPGLREAKTSGSGPTANSPWDKASKADNKEKQKAEAAEASAKLKSAQANSDTFQVIQPKTKTVVVRNLAAKAAKPEDSDVPPGFESVADSLADVADSVNGGGEAPPGFTPRPTSDSQPAVDGPVEHHYIKPKGFNKRNHSLFERIESLINMDQLAEFKVCSGRFRKGEADASSYCASVVRLFGRDGAMLVFPELIALLPDIDKQRALMRVYGEEGYWDIKRRSNEITWSNSKSKAGWGNSGSARMDMSSDPALAPAFSLLKLEVCAVCGQILARMDAVEHLKEHKMVTEFPMLGK